MKNFFEHQEAAQGRSFRLIALLSFALLGTVLVTALALALCLLIVWYYFQLRSQGTMPDVPLRLFLFWYGTLAVATGGVIAAVSYWKVEELRKGGGAVVAQELGGVLVTLEETQHDMPRRQALNVVEEMAIASGIPTPPVYILAGETGINAFAVGFTRDDAVVGLTDGCVQRLNREQLQGVVAHEFSHIFNGDMRMNVEIIGFLHGVLGISMVAKWLFQIGSDIFGGLGNNRRSGGALGLLLILTGVMLWPVGIIGLFFSLLIKAAVSRQREFLADASAVQFTRNADSIGDALKIIAGHKQGSRVRCARSLEASHVFFANGFRSLASLLDSHPPIEERIRRIDPHWDGVPIFEQESQIPPFRGAFEGTLNFLGAGAICRSGSGEQSSPAAEEEGVTTFDPLEKAAAEKVEAVRSRIPPVLLEVCKDSPGAEVTLFGLWLTADKDIDETLDANLQLLEAKLQQPTRSLVPHLATLESAARLMLLDAACQTLDTISRQELDCFAENAERLVTVSPSAEVPFRWAWRRMTRQTLAARSGQEAPKPRHGSLNPVLGPCEVLLSTLSHAGNSGPMASFAFQRGATQMGDFELVFRETDDCTLETLDMALEILAEVAPRERRQVMLAAGACLSSDQDVSEDEACLIRGVCSALNYPPPTLLPGQIATPGV